MSLVSLVNVNNVSSEIKTSISKALDLIDYKLDPKIETISIKPNLCYYWKASTGYTTDPMTVGGIIDYLRERLGNDIIINIVESDASAMRVKHAFKALDYEKLADVKKVNLLNLSNDTLEKKTVKVNGHELNLDIPTSILKSDLLINVPTLKVIGITKITCAMKNLFGCLGKRRKIQYHSNINEVIVGINKIIQPHINIVDSIVALGKYPVKMNLIMAGTNAFSIDWVAAKIMGYKPRNIKFLKIGRKEDLGNPDKIMTVGDDLDIFKKVFPSPNGIIPTPSNEFLIKLLHLYSRIVGDVVPPFLE